MRHERLVGVAVLVLLGVGLLQPWERAADAWVRHTGAVVPGGDFEMRFADRGVRTVAVLGERTLPGGATMRSTAFAAVLHFPGDSLVEQGEAVQARPFSRAIGYSWVVVRQISDHEWVGDGVRFAAVYNALDNTVRMDGHVYPLDRGNVFDVRLGSGRMQVRQLAVTWTGDHPDGPLFDELAYGPQPRHRPCPPKPSAAAGTPDHTV